MYCACFFSCVKEIAQRKRHNTMKKHKNAHNTIKTKEHKIQTSQLMEKWCDMKNAIKKKHITHAQQR